MKRSAIICQLSSRGSFFILKIILNRPARNFGLFTTTIFIKAPPKCLYLILFGFMLFDTQYSIITRIFPSYTCISPYSSLKLLLTPKGKSRVTVISSPPYFSPRMASRELSVRENTEIYPAPLPSYRLVPSVCTNILQLLSMMQPSPP